MTQPQAITDQLVELHDGDETVIARLLPQIRAELRRIASFWLKKEGAAHSVDASDLVQDTTLRLLLPGTGPWNSREHFFAVAAITIRRRLIEHARARKAKKRGGGSLKRALLEDVAAAQYEDACKFLDVQRAIRRLETINERQGRVVTLRIFSGMTVEETARILGVGRTTVNDDWAIATAFLRRELKSYCDAPSMGTN